MPPNAASGTFPLQRGDLTGIATQYNLDTLEPNMVALKIAPLFSVEEDSGIGLFWNRGNTRANAKNRGGNTDGFRRFSPRFGKFTYETSEKGLEGEIPDRLKARVKSLFDLEAAVSKQTLANTRLSHQALILSIALNTTNLPLAGSTGLSVVNEWDDPDNATPITDLMPGKLAMSRKNGAGVKLGLAMAEYTFLNLGICKQIRESLGLKYNSGKNDAAEVSAEALATALGVARVDVDRTATNTALEGATEAMNAMFDPEYALLYVIPEGGPQDSPQFCRTLVWEGNSKAFAIETYREESQTRDVVRCRFDTDEKVLNTDAAFLYGNLKT